MAHHFWRFHSVHCFDTVSWVIGRHLASE